MVQASYRVIKMLSNIASIKKITYPIQKQASYVK